MFLLFSGGWQKWKHKPAWDQDSSPCREQTYKNQFWSKDREWASYLACISHAGAFWLSETCLWTHSKDAHNHLFVEVHANASFTPGVPSSLSPCSLAVWSAYCTPDAKAGTLLTTFVTNAPLAHRAQASGAPALCSSFHCSIAPTLMKSLWCASMYWKISISNAEEDEQDITALESSTGLKWMLSES